MRMLNNKNLFKKKNVSADICVYAQDVRLWQKKDESMTWNKYLQNFKFNNLRN